ncbi:hypoxia-inducible factor 1-alpha isoform X2 [Nasonia vitripennis]|uniref:Hypoxia-inducible factor 1-alpha n=1 Tax=Nasonia vitripennis TaxID=7425 RepID=A0A7M7QE32_NASVI|nr:hypoxia-inducible factor 1-alpha isoform X2 [Nasonia vitripennis]
MKEKRRSNEKRKEKSRDAARCRRSRETDIFTELAAALPVPPCEAAHLDKASVMRLAIAYLKTRTLMDAVPKPLAKPEISPEMDELFSKAMDGFVLVLDNNGDMVYLSPNVKDYLGIAQIDLMGQSVFDYSHPCDHDEIRESFSLKASEVNEDHPCNFFLRLKCTLTSKGRKVNLKSASYKVIHCTGRLFAHTVNNVSGNASESEEQAENGEREPGVSLVVVASPVPHPSNIEIPLGKYTFLSKHNLNMKFTYADDKLAEFLGWESNELMGQSVFDFHHALDNSSLDKSFKSLFHKGQCETMAYRFLNKKGGYAWVVTQATLIHCSRLQKPLSVVCVNYLLSGVECEDEVYSVRQLEARADQLKEEPKPTAVVPPRKPLADKPVSVTASLFQSFQERPAKQQSRNVVVDVGKENDEPQDSAKAKANVPVCEVEPKPQQQTSIPDPPLHRPAPQTATASIFAPRTKDMNKGFLTFSEDQPGLTMLKDEPEDLTHLAPTAGDVCVPLEEPPFLSDMLDEFILNANYCPLLSPELTDVVCNTSGNSNQSSGKDVEQTILGDSALRRDDCNSSDGDPFIYRDSPSRCSLGTDLHSPTLTKSPEGSGIGDSLNSPNDSGGGLSEDEMLMLSISDVMADDELALRAPYIPMSDQDEALQMLISDDMVMWGPSQSNEKKCKWLTDAGEENANSSLAQLLTDESSSKKMKDHAGILVNPTHVLGQISLKNTTKDTTADRERTNKRVHAYSKSSHESKRVKHNDVPTSSNNNNNNGNISSLENILSSSVQSSQLLQQLVSQQVPKNRSWPDQLSTTQESQRTSSNNVNGNNLYEESNLCRLNDESVGLSNPRKNVFEHDGGGRPTSQRQQQQQQSNSVLMNLLVSGCDMQNTQSQLQDPTSFLSNPPLLLDQDKISPLQISVEEQLQTVPQWTNNSSTIGIDHQHLSPILMRDKQQIPQPTTVGFEALGYDDDLGFMSDAQNDDLFRALDSSLV